MVVVYGGLWKDLRVGGKTDVSLIGRAEDRLLALSVVLPEQGPRALPGSGLASKSLRRSRSPAGASPLTRRARRTEPTGQPPAQRTALLLRGQLKPPHSSIKIVARRPHRLGLASSKRELGCGSESKIPLLQVRKPSIDRRGGRSEGSENGLIRKRAKLDTISID